MFNTQVTNSDLNPEEDDVWRQQWRARSAQVQELVKAKEYEQVYAERKQQLLEQQNTTTKSKSEEWNDQAAWASQAGVSLDVIVGSDDGDDDDEKGTNGAVWDESDQLLMIPGSMLEQVDQELQEEWNAMQGEDVPMPELLSGSGNRRRNRQGVRVGSAGSWTLEVFPGDFLVHRKYGIGRFERTCLRPKTKLSEEEVQAQRERRREILQEHIRNRDATSKGPITDEDVKELQSMFGTEQDTDPISNPQVTVLEIAYSDVMVHVPVDKAYRLSRYRSGDSVVKPKLSRARGQAWGRAKEKVQENTLAMAQDVLVLYSKREMLSRTPADPGLEEQVDVFSQSFPYTPTPDQDRCFEDIENDMVWRKRPMDRLVCGDVGFGKVSFCVCLCCPVLYWFIDDCCCTLPIDRSRIARTVSLCYKWSAGSLSFSNGCIGCPALQKCSSANGTRHTLQCDCGTLAWRSTQKFFGRTRFT